MVHIKKKKKKKTEGENLLKFLLCSHWGGCES